MAAQPKNNIGNVMIITPNRERNNKTTHAYISADNSVNKEGNSIQKLLNNYWGAAPVQYKSFLIDNEITRYCPRTSPPGFGMMTFVVEETDVQNNRVENIGTEAFDEANLKNFNGNTTYRFVLEGYYIWRHEDSVYAADGFGNIGDADGTATHLLTTFGTEQRDGETWYYLIVRAGNVKNGAPSVIEEYKGGGSIPPGSGTPIPPPTN